ncbi:MAG: PAS domain S-box protein, partial [Gallionella sp.]|nr:PAS domain S-box protein [Gallionella sp.]
MKNWRLSVLLSNPLAIIIAVAAVVFSVELLFMALHGLLVPMFELSNLTWGVIDAVTLSAAVAPLLYFLVFRKIQESEERFRQINATAQDAIIVVDEQARITDWNLAAQKMFQYSPEEALGQQLHQLIAPPRFHADAARGFARFQETGAGPLIGKTTELLAMRKDGSEFSIEHSISAIKVKDRWHALGVMRDLTERKHVEAAFTTLVGTAATNIGVAFFRETVRSLSAWLGVECVIIGELQEGNRVRALAMQLDGQAVEHYEYALPGTPCNSVASKGYCEYPEGVCQLFPQDKDLSDMGAEAYVGMPIRDKNGKSIGVLCAISRHKIVPQTITKGVFEIIATRAGTEIERQRAEDLVGAKLVEIRRARLEWQAVFDSIGQPIFLHDGEFRVTRANMAYAKAAGMDIRDVIGQPYWKIFPRGEGPMASCSQSMHSHKEQSEEFRTDGEIYLSRAFAAGISSGEQYSVHILENVTERKKTEKQVAEQYEHVARINDHLAAANKQLQLAQNQLLQSEKMASVGLMAAGVAHEINNPIGYVNSNLGTLEKYLADIFAVLNEYEAAEMLLDKDNPQFEELRHLKEEINLGYLREDIKALLAESHQGLERVKKIVLDLKNFSHADSEDQWMWADIHRGLDTTLNVVWNELKYKCEVVKEYGSLPEIYCLPSQLNQVFMNLLVNAAQAIEVRGTITLRTGQDGDRVWVEVSDTGKGILPEDFPHLFDPFFTTKPVGKGTGLGLSVSYSIVERHRGKI